MSYFESQLDRYIDALTDAERAADWLADHPGEELPDDDGLAAWQLEYDGD